MFQKIAKKPGLLPWVLGEGLLGPFSAFFLTLLFPLHLRNLIGDGGQTDRYWGVTNSITLGVVAITTLFWGPWMDRKGSRRGFLRLTGLAVIAGSSLALLPNRPVAALLLFALALLNYQWLNVAYNAYLNDLAAPDERPSVSALGWATGYAANLILLLVALPIIRGPWGEARGVRLALVLVPAAGTLCLLPAALRLPAVPPKPASGPPIWGLLKIRAILVFLLASALYMDGVTTVIEFAGRFATETIGFSGTELIGLFAILQLCGVAGALAIGRLARAFGDRPALLGTLATWVALLAGLHFVRGKLDFMLLAGFAGAGLGAAGSGSRALLSKILPAGREAEGYGLFAITTRFGAIFGPALFGYISLLRGQRAAVLTMIPFFVIGAILLTAMPARGNAI